MQPAGLQEDDQQVPRCAGGGGTSPRLVRCCACACAAIGVIALLHQALGAAADSRRSAVASRYDRQQCVGRALSLQQPVSTSYARALYDALADEATGADATSVVCDLTYDAVPGTHRAPSPVADVVAVDYSGVTGDDTLDAGLGQMAAWNVPDGGCAVATLAWPPAWRADAPPPSSTSGPMTACASRAFLAGIFAWYADQASLAARRRLHWTCATAAVSLALDERTREPLPLLQSRASRLVGAMRACASAKLAMSAVPVVRPADASITSAASADDMAYFVLVSASCARVVHGADTMASALREASPVTDFELVLCLLPLPPFMFSDASADAAHRPAQ